MLRKKIKFTDYNGVEREEEFMFNLTEAELAEMDMVAEGGLAVKIEKITKTVNGEEIVNIFKDIILKSYGEKSHDGRRFIKNQELRDDFIQTEAYSVLFMELASDDKAAAAFINGIAPQPKQEKMNPPVAR